MLIEPSDLPASVGAEAFHRNWAIDVATIEYAPVGFGSHHWWIEAVDGTRWFATIDDLRMGARSGAVLTAALQTAAALHTAGMDSVVAPLLSDNGDVATQLQSNYVLAVYPFVHGTTSGFGPYASHAERSAVVAELVRLHELTALVRHIAPVDDLTIPLREELGASLQALDVEWGAGPYAQRARAELSLHRTGFLAALERYDDLATAARLDQGDWVITHGEPHRANVIMTTDGVRLIDWETARIAPRERDLWMLADEDPSVVPEYSDRSGCAVDMERLELYRLWWDLCEVSLFTADFRSPHEANDETRVAWAGFQKHLLRASSAAAS